MSNVQVWLFDGSLISLTLRKLSCVVIRENQTVIPWFVSGRLPVGYEAHVQENVADQSRVTPCERFAFLGPWSIASRG